MDSPVGWSIPLSRLLLISQKGGVSLDWPCLDTLLLFKLTPLPPALFDCYGCLRKIRRRHYHIDRATGTRRKGNLSSSSSMEARSNRTSDTFGITSEGQWRTVGLRVGIYDGYDE